MILIGTKILNYVWLNLNVSILMCNQNELFSDFCTITMYFMISGWCNQQIGYVIVIHLCKVIYITAVGMTI